MQILIRTVHTVQQTVFWGWLSCACCCATTGALVGVRRKLWSPQLPFFWGSRNAWFDYGGFWMNFYVFPRDWEDSAPEVDSRRSLHTWPMRKWPCSSSTVAVACVLLVLLVMHLALCSRCCRPFFFCSRAALGNLYIISTSLQYFQHFPQSNFCAS